MYFRKALSVLCSDVQKLNMYGCPNGETVCGEPTLGIADVWVNFPSVTPASVNDCKSQQAFVRDLVHEGIVAASKRFGFAVDNFVEAKLYVEQSDYQLSYQIGNSKASPDRKYTAAVWCNFDNQYICKLRVMNRDGTLLCVCHFANGNEHSIGQLRWDGCDNVRIPLTTVTGDAYWNCHLDGSVRFVFPKSETGDPHHLYQHAILLLDWAFVVFDRTARLDLLVRSVSPGFKYAIRRLHREKQHQGIHADPPDNWITSTRAG